MEKNNWCVYVHTNKINGKKYVGITSKHPQERWRNGNGYYGQRFYFAIKKYGWDNFDHEIIIPNTTETEAKKLEKIYIKMWDTKNRQTGYNLTDGGEGVCGFLVSSETRKKQSLAKLNPSAETRRRLSDSHKGIKQSYKCKEILKHIMSTNHPARMPVVCGDNEFYSVSECADNYGVNRETMMRWLRGDRDMPKNFFDMGLRYAVSDKKEYKPFTGELSKEVVCGGKVYPSISDCAKHYGVKNGTMQMWLNGKNGMPQEFIEMGLRLKNKDVAYRKKRSSSGGKEVICGGVIFESGAACARNYSVNPKTMQSWLVGKYGMPQKFQELGLAYYIEGCLEARKIA